MKFSQLSILLFAAFTSIQAALTSVDLDSWSKSDLQGFLEDFQVPYNAAQDSAKDLAVKARSQWNSFTLPYTSWSTNELAAYLKRKNVQHKVNLGAADAKDKLTDIVARVYPDNGSVDQTVKNAKDAASAVPSSVFAGYDKVSGWIFDSWSTDQLQAFVKKHSKDAQDVASATRKDLTARAKKIYDARATDKSHAADNFYPSKWLYESWTDSDLEQWLRKQQISVPRNAGAGAAQNTLALHRDKLVSAVRKNSRYAALSIQDARNTLLDKAGISKANNVYDKVTKKVSPGVFESWTDPQIRNWLLSHQLMDPKEPTSRDALLKKARESIDYLSNDVSYYIDAASRTASPILNKAGDAIKSAPGAAQDALDEHFGLWEPEQLSKFVDSVRSYVPAWFEQHAHKVAADTKWAQERTVNFAHKLFDHWSAADLVKWLEKEGQQIDASVKSNRDELASRATSHLSKAHEYSAEKYRQLVARFSADFGGAADKAFEAWNDADLQSWLTARGVQHQAKATHADLVKAARGAWESSFLRGFWDAPTQAKDTVKVAASAAASAAGQASTAAGEAAAAAGGYVPEFATSAWSWVWARIPGHERTEL